ncbi:MAG: hypothetical protein ACRC6A_13225 [Fusobacteriaceae bacterium]
MINKNLGKDLKNDPEYLKEILDSVYKTIYLANISTVDLGEEDRAFKFVEIKK